jgi:ribosomal protein L11 methyltransferase
VWSVFIPADTEAADSLSAELWEMGTAGLIEEANGLRAFFGDSVDQTVVCAKFALAPYATRPETPFDHTRIAPLACDPILIGQRFYVAPSWITEPTPAGRFRLTIDATSAFGSGRHESTQMCMEVMEKHLKAGSLVVDIGCGSGILAAAATLLGAKTVISCDIHQDSASTAQTFLPTPVFVGSADGLRSRLAGLVLANLSVKVLDVIASDLRRIAEPGGLIVLSGFLRENPPKKFTPWEVWEKSGWQCWICRPQDIDATAEPGEPAPHTQQWWL